MSELRGASLAPTPPSPIDPRATYLDRWPDALARLSFATVFHLLTKAERDALIAIFEWNNGEGEPPNDAILQSLQDSLREQIALFPHGAFVKLVSRSPKDVGRHAPILDGRAALDLLGQSERVYEDLCAARMWGETSAVAVREWRQIPPDEEWRVFVKDHRIVGVSQYCYFETFPDLKSHADAVRWTIDTFFAQSLRSALHLDPIVCDLWVHRRVGPDSEITWTVRLIEVNPYGPWTDPCEFAWRTEPVWSRADPYELRICEPD